MYIYGIGGDINELFVKMLLNIFQYTTTSALLMYVVLSCSSFYQHEFSLVPNRIGNHMFSKMWDEMNNPFQNSTVIPFKFEKGRVMYSHTFNYWSI